MDYRRFLTYRNVLIVVIAFAMIGFFQLHDAYGAFAHNPLSGVMYGDIWITDACVANSNDDALCGILLPYRELLSVLVVIAAVALIALPRKSN